MEGKIYFMKLYWATKTNYTSYFFRDVDETLRLVQAFQYTDKHGEVCPAGWKPGQKTMKADPKGSKEYFKAAN